MSRKAPTTRPTSTTPTVPSEPWYSWKSLQPHVPLALKTLAWCICYGITIHYEFGAVFFVISAIIIIFRNLSNDTKNKNKPSAYAAFNRDGRALPGTFTAAQFERQLLHKEAVTEANTVEIDGPKQHFQRKSKAANQPCVCGSGKKYKNCCSPLTTSAKKVDEEYAEWEKEWT